MNDIKFRKNTLLKLAKANNVKRVSKEALIEIEKAMIDLSEKISKRAIELANHAKRLTVKKEDIELASR
ncbi:MAG: histone [Candidatus Aenigmatarchaeota archaeon]|mgnify:CR=1 FL=1|jgi:histone H3/H4